MREEDFPCLGEPERPITEDLCRNAGARYTSVFSKAEDMVRAALEVKRLNRDVWVKLPFCVTIEAEALGAEVSLNSLYGVPAVMSGWQILRNCLIWIFPRGGWRRSCGRLPFCRPREKISC